MINVLDSSAMVAYLTGEPEGETVRALLEGAHADSENALIYAHSVNLAETFYHITLAQPDLPLPERETLAEAAMQILRDVGVVERSDMDAQFWRSIARIIHQARALPTTAGTRGTLALGDAFGVCLANRLGADFVTKDRSEIEPLEQIGLVSAFFIR